MKDLEVVNNAKNKAILRAEKAEMQLTKGKEILQVVLDKWKEERWILQSEEEVRKIENLMEQTEQFIKE